jgi:serine/threonine protein phosphatase PrpC
MLSVDFSGDTHVGMKREINQDALLLMPEESLFVVADGMGGHKAGEVASRLAIRTIKEFFLETGRDKDITWPFRQEGDRVYEADRLVAAVKLANLRVFETAKDNPDMKGMGTTVVALHQSEGKVYIAHVGDSRVYLLRDGRLNQLTVDHSLLNDFKKSMTMTAEDEARFPYKNIIVRALGMKENVEVDLTVVEPLPGDLFLLCSDGLTGEISDQQIERLLYEETNIVRASGRLIAMANEAGGRDNTTVVLLRIRNGVDGELADLEDEVMRELDRENRTRG